MTETISGGGGTAGLIEDARTRGNAGDPFPGAGKMIINDVTRLVKGNCGQIGSKRVSICRHENAGVRWVLCHTYSENHKGHSKLFFSRLLLKRKCPLYVNCCIPVCANSGQSLGWFTGLFTKDEKLSKATGHERCKNTEISPSPPPLPIFVVVKIHAFGNEHYNLLM
jgi:hypothetical protein